jgi:pimeloyl-ACP methyl ester carboxylesterase
MPALTSHFTVLAMDRRGRGQSGDAGVYALEREFEDVLAVTTAAGPETSLLGHSFGALCAMEAALSAGNLRRLVLYEPGFPAGGMKIYPPGAREKLQALLDANDRDRLLITYFGEMIGMPASDVAALRKDPFWTTRMETAHTLVREMDEDDYRFDPARFRHLAIPTLLLCGEHSPEILRAASEDIASALPHARIVVLKGQGHVAMTTAPEIFVNEIVRFLAD